MLSEATPPEESLPRVASLATRAAADLCMVDLGSPDGIATRAAAAHRDPARAEQLRGLQRSPPDLTDSDNPLGWVARTGEILLLPQIHDDWLEETVGDAEYWERALAAGCAAYLEKPCPPEVVLAAIRDLFPSPRPPPPSPASAPRCRPRDPAQSPAASPGLQQERHWCR